MYLILYIKRKKITSIHVVVTLGVRISAQKLDDWSTTCRWRNSSRYRGAL